MEKFTIEELQNLLQNLNCLPESDQIILRKNIQNRIQELKRKEVKPTETNFKIPKSPKIKKVDSITHLIEKSRLLNQKWNGKLSFDSKEIPFQFKIDDISPTGSFIDIKLTGLFKIFVAHTHMNNKLIISRKDGYKIIQNEPKKLNEDEIIAVRPRPYYNYRLFCEGLSYRKKKSIENVDISHIDISEVSKNIGTNRNVFNGYMEGDFFDDEIYGQITFEESYCILEFVQEYDQLAWITNGEDYSNKISYRHFYLKLNYSTGIMKGKYWSFEREIDLNENLKIDFNDSRIHDFGNVKITFQNK